MLIVCDYCGIVFNKNPHRIKKSKEHFCCTNCKASGRRKENEIIKLDEATILILCKDKQVKIDAEDWERVKKFCWNIQNNGYVVYSNKSILLHRFIMSCPKGFEVDHINHNRLDNRKQNLRICTTKENSQNQRLSCVNTSNHIGVRKYVRTGKWVSNIGINNKLIHLGYFDTMDEAIKAREDAEKKYFPYKEGIKSHAR